MENINHKCSGLEAIRELFIDFRKEHGYSQEYIALQLNISQAAYSKFEQGMQCLSPDKLITLYRFYGIDVCEELVKLMQQKLMQKNTFLN
jgi:transcriptional regulator with XRE-family HTH domain